MNDKEKNFEQLLDEEREKKERAELVRRKAPECKTSLGDLLRDAGLEGDNRGRA